MASDNKNGMQERQWEIKHENDEKNMTAPWLTSKIVDAMM